MLIVCDKSTWICFEHFSAWTLWSEFCYECKMQDLKIFSLWKTNIYLWNWRNMVAIKLRCVGLTYMNAWSVWKSPVVQGFAWVSKALMITMLLCKWMEDRFNMLKELLPQHNALPWIPMLQDVSCFILGTGEPFYGFLCSHLHTMSRIVWHLHDFHSLCFQQAQYSIYNKFRAGFYIDI